jgi:hypothetical protein
MTTVGRIHLVLVPTTDPDRSIAFYASLGFAKRADFPYGDGSTPRPRHSAGRAPSAL